MDITRKLLFILAVSLANVDTDAQNKSWMGDLPDDAKVRELSIPGSHDSATGDGFADGSAFLAMFSGVTQSVSISNIEKLAVAINKFVVEHLDESIKQNPGRTGIFMMDFAGVSSKGSAIVYGDVLVNKIISLNNLYLHNNTSGLSYVKIEQDSKLPVYNIMGNCVGYGVESLANLPVGIYIYNGKKVLVQ